VVFTGPHVYQKTGETFFCNELLFAEQEQGTPYAKDLYFNPYLPGLTGRTTKLCFSICLRRNRPGTDPRRAKAARQQKILHYSLFMPEAPIPIGYPEGPDFVHRLLIQLPTNISAALLLKCFAEAPPKVRKFRHPKSVKSGIPKPVKH